MTVWLLTIGTSDVQVQPKNSWNQLFRQQRSRLNSQLQFEPRQLDKDPRKPSLVQPRVMGIVYENAGLDDLAFPLLDNFRQEIDRQGIVLGQDDRIILILSDQSGIFIPQHYTVDKACPYWQDTCTLQPILDRYFQQYFPAAVREYLTLRPMDEGAGLDDWDEVLVLMQKLLENQVAGAEETVYVSHQAGTPAISSAVQFCSLAKFGQRTRFLVGNEFDTDLTKVIDSSRYLFSIQHQAAQMLIERYDYVGARDLLKPYLYNYKSDASKAVQATFRALVQWNLAEFSDFAKLLKKIPELKARVEERCQNWWWLGYESAYLGIIRYYQSNTVEALFHSCRAIESLVCDWAKWRFSEHYREDSVGAPQIKDSIFDALAGYQQRIPFAAQKIFEREGYAGLYGKTLYSLLEIDRADDVAEGSVLRDFLDYTVKQRNQYFHRSLGLKDAQLFQAWLKDRPVQETAEQVWATRILACLNVITGESYASFGEASLMASVHDLLVAQVMQYDPFDE
jgi:hypothetical protein